jgi:hypothetical protein
LSISARAIQDVVSAAAQKVNTSSVLQRNFNAESAETAENDRIVKWDFDFAVAVPLFLFFSAFSAPSAVKNTV